MVACEPASFYFGGKNAIAVVSLLRVFAKIASVVLLFCDQERAEQLLVKMIFPLYCSQRVQYFAQKVAVTSRPCSRTWPIISRSLITIAKKIFLSFGFYFRLSSQPWEFRCARDPLAEGK